MSSIPQIFYNQTVTNEAQEALHLLERTFNAQVQLARPLDQYDIYRALMRVTQVVRDQLPHLTSNWLRTLEKIDGTKLHVKHSYPICIKTSIAKKELAGNTGASISRVKLNDSLQREAFISYLIESDSSTFREHLSRGFYDAMLNPNKTLALAAHDDKGQIVGGLWGFFTECQEQKIFHAWSLSIQPEFSRLGIAKELIASAKKLREDEFQKVQMASLNVHRDNLHAKEIYENEEFLELPTQDPHHEKLFMTRTYESEAAPTQPEAKTLVKDYVMANASLCQLVVWELVRRVGFLFTRIYWGFANPKCQILEINKTKSP